MTTYRQYDLLAILAYTDPTPAELDENCGFIKFPVNGLTISEHCRHLPMALGLRDGVDYSDNQNFAEIDYHSIGIYYND